MPNRNIQDKILYLRLKKKDKDAFVKAYDLYLDDLYRFIFFKVNSKEEAEDIASSVFLKTWDYIQNNKLGDYETLKALLYKIARNMVIDHYRKRSSQPNISYDNQDNFLNLMDEKQDILKEAEVGADIEMVREKMRELKEEYREIIILRYINELSIPEISHILDKSKGNIRVLAFRAINALREIINQDNEKK